ncbi:MAG: hypothetical protein JXX29_06220 [Deltaproteobacteria bacterium]|nr:hypothetical protein [Deltaproteobacteria bacterium]MBN2671246.1 hypothetical protein [Deltaproteobacteria bacterium]
MHIPTLFGAILLTAMLAGMSAHSQEEQDTDSEKELPSIILLENVHSDPSMLEVSTLLLPSMDEIGVRMRIDTVVAHFPASQTDWSLYTTQKGKEAPGLLAVFSWNCPAEDECYIYAVEGKSLALTSVPVGDGWKRETALAPKHTHSISSATNIAAGIREIVYSDLLLAFPQVARQANRPPKKVEQKPRNRLLAPHEEQQVEEVTAEPFVPPVIDHQDRKFWLDAAYMGAYPYPSSRTVHGISLGTTLYLAAHFAPALRIGALARREAAGENGRIYAYAFPVGLHMKFPMNVGPAIFSIAPVVQWDIILVSKQPVEREISASTHFDLSFGGETTWNVPMPRSDIELFFGAGILATVLSEEYSISGESIMDDVRLQFYWLAGVSKNVSAR